jgi:DNA-binding NarL/FixJ family response regulator
MKRAIQNGVLAVCVIEQNPLAATYLEQILSRDPKVRTFAPEDFTRAFAPPVPSPIFVVDAFGLVLPLSECLRRLRTQCPSGRYVVLGRTQSKDEIVRLLWLGIHGLLTYAEVGKLLPVALRAVFEGRIWVPPEALEAYVLQTSAARRNAGSGNGRDELTLRETEIIELVKRRLSNKEIGEALTIRESTVKFHLANVFSKCRISRRRDLFDGSRREAPGIGA